MTQRPRIGLFSLVVAASLLADQVTKWQAVARLQGEPRIELIPGWLSLTFLRNPGAAFGMGASMTIVLTAVAVVVCVYVIKIASRLRDLGWTVALGLLLGGAVGNLLDRILREPAVFRGHVVDFIDYHGWFVGNVADICLTVAAVIIVVRSWQGIGPDHVR